MATIISTRKVHDKYEKQLQKSGDLKGRLTFREVSRQSGLDTRTVSALYRGTMESISRQTLQTVRDFYQCDYGELFFDIPDDLGIRTANPTRMPASMS